MKAFKRSIGGRNKVFLETEEMMPELLKLGYRNDIKPRAFQTLEERQAMFNPTKWCTSWSIVYGIETAYTRDGACHIYTGADKVTVRHGDHEATFCATLVGNVEHLFVQIENELCPKTIVMPSTTQWEWDYDDFD